MYWCEGRGGGGGGRGVYFKNKFLLGVGVPSFFLLLLFGRAGCLYFVHFTPFSFISFLQFVLLFLVVAREEQLKW